MPGQLQPSTLGGGQAGPGWASRHPTTGLWGWSLEGRGYLWVWLTVSGVATGKLERGWGGVQEPKDTLWVYMGVGSYGCPGGATS